MSSRHPDTCALIVDQANQRVIEVRKTVLVNQITRDADKIGKSFDKLHGDELAKISEQFALCFALLTTGMLKASEEHDELRVACGEVLSNTLNSLAAATYLLRGGFVLQPGPVIRSCYESLAVVLHLIQFQSDLPKYRNHTFDSTRAISSAKAVFPPFGKIYGLLSKEFTHIGQLYKQITPIREYTESYEPLSLNMQFVTTGVWMCYVTCELVFLNVVGKPRYWSDVSVEAPNQEAVYYSPSPEERAWAERFLGMTAP